MKRRWARPIVVSVFGAIGVLTIAGVVLAYSPPTIRPGTGTGAGQTNVRNWTLTPDSPYFKVEAATTSDKSDAVKVTLAAGANTYRTPATVGTLYVRSILLLTTAATSPGTARTGTAERARRRLRS